MQRIPAISAASCNSPWFLPGAAGSTPGARMSYDAGLACIQPWYWFGDGCSAPALWWATGRGALSPLHWQLGNPPLESLPGGSHLQEDTGTELCLEHSTTAGLSKARYSTELRFYYMYQRFQLVHFLVPPSDHLEHHRGMPLIHSVSNYLCRDGQEGPLELFPGQDYNRGDIAGIQSSLCGEWRGGRGTVGGRQGRRIGGDI